MATIRRLIDRLIIDPENFLRLWKERAFEMVLPPWGGAPVSPGTLMIRRERPSAFDPRQSTGRTMPQHGNPGIPFKVRASATRHAAGGNWSEKAVRHHMKGPPGICSDGPPGSKLIGNGNLLSPGTSVKRFSALLWSRKCISVVEDRQGVVATTGIPLPSPGKTCPFIAGPRRITVVSSPNGREA
jgi:hypothetical protein